MPEGVSIAKQALARGYALVALNSADRRVGSGARCWSWASDAAFVKDLVEEFRKEHDLQNKPLFFTGCSSGGSLALRLPGIMKLDGVFSVAIGLEQGAFPLSSQGAKLKDPYPPSVLIHFTADKSTDAKVKGMLETMERKRVPGVEQLVAEKPITPDFFSTRDPMISLALSQRLHSAFKNELQILNESDYLIPGEQLSSWLHRLQAVWLQLQRRTAGPACRTALLCTCVHTCSQL
jgi:predicted esterase